MFSSALVASLLLGTPYSYALVARAPCALSFDGRFKANAVAADIDAGATSFRADNVLGKELKWAQAAVFPDVIPSIGDLATNTKAVEVTVNDRSIFNPGGKPQNGFRRAELLIGTDDTSTDFFIETRTLHFSIQSNAARPLNLSHEYQLFFTESADFSTNQIVLKTGTIIGGSAAQVADPNVLRLFGNVKESPPTVLFETPFTAGWNNFALQLDFDKNNVQVFFSNGQEALQAVGAAQPNDLSGQGEIHFGLLKKSTNTDGIVNTGFQESGIDEGIIYGGIFQEAGVNGCIAG